MSIPDKLFKDWFEIIETHGQKSKIGMVEDVRSRVVYDKMNNALNDAGFSIVTNKWFELPVMPYRHKRYLVSDGEDVCSVAKWDGKSFDLLDGCGIQRVIKWMEIPQTTLLTHHKNKL